MSFENSERGARIGLAHTMLPDQFLERWNDLYWAPLRARFGGGRGTR